MTIASVDALFGEPEVKFVNPILIPITAYLLGLKKAKEFLYLGDLWSATDVERLGLINRVVPTADLEQETNALAHKLAGIPAAALRLNKRAINRVWDLMGFGQSLGFDEELLAYVTAYQAAVSGSDRDADNGFRSRASTTGLRDALEGL
jgi:enoyl-CoA hydratase